MTRQNSLSEKKLKFFAHKKSQNKTDVLLLKDVKATFQRILERISETEYHDIPEQTINIVDIKRIIKEESGFE